MADFIDSVTSTIDSIRHSPTPGTFIKQRLLANAEEMSNAARIQGSVEVANEALCRMASICYETVDKTLVNVDGRNFRLLVPAPWGDAGYSKWGMRAVEARILRAVLMSRLDREPEVSLYSYDNRQWFLNYRTYKSPSMALEYLKSRPVTAREWLRHANAWHERERQRANTKAKMN